MAGTYAIYLRQVSTTLSASTMLHFASVAGIPEDNVIKDTSWGRNLAMDCSKLAAFGINFPITEESVSACLL